MTYSGNFVVTNQYPVQSFVVDISALSNEVFYSVNHPTSSDAITEFNIYIQERRTLKKPAIYIIYQFSFIPSRMIYYPKYTVVLDYTLTFEYPTRLSLIEMQKIETNVKQFADFSKTNIDTSISYNQGFLFCSGYKIPDSIAIANMLVEEQNQNKPTTDFDVVHTCRTCIYLGTVPGGLVCNAIQTIPDGGVFVKNDCSEWHFLNSFYHRFNEQLLQFKVIEPE